MPEAPHIFRWDLDKTYLDTDFDSLGALIRTAFQKPAEKTNVPGSAELLRELRAASGGQALIYFISGSPRQMRDVLAEKLRLDGVHFDGFILKDNLRNLLKGRFRALREQVGYKLPALLQARVGAPVESQETLFGDDAERDAFVYSLYADLLARRVPREVLDEVLAVAGVYEDGRAAVFDALDKLGPVDPVRRIIIHLERRSPPHRFEVYGSRVVPIYNYFQASLVLYQDARLPADAVARIGTALVEQHAFTEPMLLRSFQDALRRRILDLGAAERLGRQVASAGVRPEVVHLFAQAARDVNITSAIGDAAHRIVPDYPALLAREIERHRIEKARRRRIGRRWL